MGAVRAGSDPGWVVVFRAGSGWVRCVPGVIRVGWWCFAPDPDGCGACGSDPVAEGHHRRSLRGRKLCRFRATLGTESLQIVGLWWMWAWHSSTMSSRRDIDRLILGLASVNDSVVHARQLRAAGVDKDHVLRRVRSGWMTPIVGDSYGVGPMAAEPTTSMLRRAALLHGGDQARLTNETGAEVLAGWDRGDGRIHVISPRDIGCGDRRIVFHRTRIGVVGRAAREQRWPVVDPICLCVNLGTALSPWQLCNVVRELIYRGHLTLDQLQEFVARPRRIAGMSVLRDAVALAVSNSAGTRGRTEDRFLELVRSAGLPVPRVNVRGLMGIPNDEPDFVHCDTRMNFECDGGHHLEPAQEQQDHDRDMMAGRRGWRVRRFWWRDVWDFPELVIAAMRAAFLSNVDPIEYCEHRWQIGRYRLEE